MAKVILPPSAAALMQSFRGIGYDVKTAIADLVDNSIAANASAVWISFNWDGRHSYVTILDNGDGMSQERLDAAMTLGVGGPGIARNPRDLGRFGLGLKTASLSQCKRLAVISRAGDCAVAQRIWDLDEVVASNEWVAGDELRSGEQDAVQSLHALNSGTLVLWCSLDRLVGDAEVDDEIRMRDFQLTAQTVESHLAMVFHRYLDGTRPRLRIYVNGTDDEYRVKPWDPYCQWHGSTQGLPETRRAMSGGGVALQGFVLPHKDRFDGDGFERAGGPAGWTAQQGFYVYRNERLLVAGSWLGLGDGRRWTRDEQHKLARIRLDLPNSLDDAWAIDIKKAVARPPVHLKAWLVKNATAVRERARNVFVHRGKHATAQAGVGMSSIWHADGGSTPRYSINREHPMIAGLLHDGQGQSAERVLRVLEATVPIHRIWLDVSEKPEVRSAIRSQLPDSDVVKLAEGLLRGLVANGKTTRDAALRMLRAMEPFDQFPEVIDELERHVS